MRLLFFVFIILLSAQMGIADVPKTMSYQGMLTDASDKPINGNYDLTFRLYSVQNGGSWLWSETHNSANVNKGIFNVILGSKNPLNLPFDVKYWLEVQVGTNPESPRIELTSSPYSLNSQNVSDNAITTNKLADNAVTTSKLLPDVVSSVDGVSNDGGNIDLVPGPNINITSDDIANTITIGASGVWKLTGNNGTDPITNFLGTTDNKALELRVNNMRVFRLVPDVNSPNIIGGFGDNSVASGVSGATISGGGRSGSTNSISNNYGTIGGGRLNQVNGEYATVGGGVGNTASKSSDTVGGGTSNKANGGSSTVSGGYGNVTDGTYGIVSGGYKNKASANYAFVGGGASNEANALSATVGGGTSNKAISDYTTISGGRGNTASLACATVGGGDKNDASGSCATISGGFSNTTDGFYSTVGGGGSNTASGNFTTVGGGYENVAKEGATVSGGYQNNAKGYETTIGGGSSNEANGEYATIAGGHGNKANGYRATVGGGRSNQAIGPHAFVGGGEGNQASGVHSTVAGGYDNKAAGNFSFAAGRSSNADEHGSFIFADSTNTGPVYFNSRYPGNDFSVLCTGGARFVTQWNKNNGSAGGVNLPAGGTAWSSLCDRDAKANFTPVNGCEILERLASIPIQTWNYKAQEPSIRHIGPMAQDFYEAFGMGEDDKYISTIDVDGVALAAIQGLYKMVKEKETENASLKRKVADLESRLAMLEKLISSNMQGN